MKKTPTLFFAGLCLSVTQQATAQAPRIANAAIYGEQTANTFYITAAPEGSAGPYMELAPNSLPANPSRAGSIGYIAGYNQSDAAGISHTFFSRLANGGWVSHMRVLQNGQVQIGGQAPSTSQTDYRLAVDGKLVAKSLYVTNPSTWADFVFAPTYQRMPLAELEIYLQRNKHLPAIPSAKEVEAKGYNVSEMDAKLLQSLEELTLHVIELSKQNQQLQTQVVTLQEQVKAMR